MMGDDVLTMEIPNAGEAPLPLTRTSTPLSTPNTSMVSPLLRLPPEIIDEILRHLLSTEYTRVVYRPYPGLRDGDDQLFVRLGQPLDIATAPRARVAFDEPDCPTSITKCHLHPRVLGTCRRLCEQGLRILYIENKYLAVYSWYSTYREKLCSSSTRNYWGPFRPRDGKVISAISEHLVDAITRSEHTARIDPVMTYAVGHQMSRGISSSDASDKIYICPLADRDEVLRTLNIPFRKFADEVSDRAWRVPDNDERWLRLYLRSDLHIPGLCRNANALARLVLDDVVPKTRSFIDSISFGTPGVANAVDQDRQSRVNKALSKPADFDRAHPDHRFAVAYADAEKWLEQKELHALRLFGAGDTARAEELFLEVQEFAENFVRFGKLFDQLAAKFPVEHNRVLLFSSVAFYYLCKIRADPRNPQIYACDSQACLRLAKLHSITTWYQPSPVPLIEWNARLCLMRCRMTAALGDVRSCYEDLCVAVATLGSFAKQRDEEGNPLEERVADGLRDLNNSIEEMPSDEWKLTECENLAKAIEVDFIARVWGPDLDPTYKDVLYGPTEF